MNTLNNQSVIKSDNDKMIEALDILQVIPEDKLYFLFQDVLNIIDKDTFNKAYQIIIQNK